MIVFTGVITDLVIVYYQGMKNIYVDNFGSIFNIYRIIERFVFLMSTVTLDDYFLLFPCGSHVSFSCFFLSFL